jgi:hypothetical protein
MWILPILGYVGVVLGFGFLTLAIGMFVHPRFLRCRTMIMGAKVANRVRFL